MAKKADKGTTQVNSALFNKILSTSKSSFTSSLSNSQIFTRAEVFCPTDVPLLNLALSGKFLGGVGTGVTLIAGPSKHFKTMYGLKMMEAFSRKTPDGIMIFYDSEFGSTKSYLESFDIDLNRVIHIPVSNLEELRTEMASQLEVLMEEFKKTKEYPKVFVFLDSLGNLASLKETEDAVSGKNKADMTRAKVAKSLFRIVTPSINLLGIPMVAIAHSYKSQDFMPTDVVAGGCVVEGTKVRMGDGSLVEIQNIQPNQEVQTLDGDRKVTHVWNPDTLVEGEPECYEVTFDDGSTMIVSEKHMFMSEEGNVGWVNAVDSLNIQLHKYDSSSNTIVRSIIPVGKRKVYDISVEGNNQYITENGVVNHNTGPMYSANTVFVIGKQQDKAATGEIKGYRFVIKIEKSRYIKEKSKLPITVHYDKGILPFSGLAELASQLGIIKPCKIGRSAGFSYHDDEYEFDIPESEIDSSAPFWDAVFSKTDFLKRVEDYYSISCKNIISDNIVLEEDMSAAVDYDA